MAPAADAMREALAKVEVKSPAVPLVANVLARPITDPDEIRARLVEQVTGQVRWRESVEYMATQGVTHAIGARLRQGAFRSGQAYCKGCRGGYLAERRPISMR